MIIVSVVRTLTGHKSSIRGIDFHPYGEFVASGSLDTNVKVSLLMLQQFKNKENNNTVLALVTMQKYHLIKILMPFWIAEFPYENIPPSPLVPYTHTWSPTSKSKPENYLKLIATCDPGLIFLILQYLSLFSAFSPSCFWLFLF